MEFLIKGTVGMRPIQNADAAYKVRQSEIECEATLEELQAKSDAIKSKEPFYDSTDNSICMDGLTCAEFTSFIAAAEVAEAAANTMKSMLAGKKKCRPSLSQGASEIQSATWVELKEHFKEMYVRILEDIMDNAMEAFQNNGNCNGTLLDFTETDNFTKVE